MCAKSFHCVQLIAAQLFVTLWTVTHQAPFSMGFSRQEYWSRLPCPPPGEFPDPGTKLSCLLHWQVGSLPLAPPGKPRIASSFNNSGLDSKESSCNVGELGSIPGSGSSPEEENGFPLQYSCLENPMDGGAWWATAHGVTKSQARLSDFTSLCFRYSYL